MVRSCRCRSAVASALDANGLYDGTDETTCPAAAANMLFPFICMLFKMTHHQPCTNTRAKQNTTMF
jgi:hypothetical protein